jgi:hypothetical protein
MLRGFFKVLSALPLLLCIATCVLWVRSYLQADTVIRETRRGQPNSRVEDSVESRLGVLRLRHIVVDYKTQWGARAPFEQSLPSRRIRRGDTIAIGISDLFPGEVTVESVHVRGNGGISIPFLGVVRAQGRTPRQLAEVIRDEYDEASIIQESAVTVHFADSPWVASCPHATGEEGSWWTVTHDQSVKPPPAQVNLDVIFGTPAATTVPAVAPTRSRWQRAGFDGATVTRTGFTHSVREWQISIPDWLVFAALCILPGIWLPRMLQRVLRARAGRCDRCGYDLRATPNRCPECGTNKKKK